MSQPIRLATRGSPLALAQSGQVAATLQAATGREVTLVVVTTGGDRVQDRPLHDAGGKGLFTKEIELALLAREADVAVHSFKDVPVTQPLVPDSATALVVAGVPVREDVRDVLIVREGAVAVSELPAGARVGTTSLRRRALLLDARPDLHISTLRGNVDTRLGKLAEGAFDAIVLAAAGLKRLGRFDAARMHPLPVAAFVPAAGQGALALQCRADDAALVAALGGLSDRATADCVAAERAVVRLLDGDCQSPIGAYAWFEGGSMHLRVAVGRAGGELPVVRGEVAGEAVPAALAESAVNRITRATASDSGGHKA
ncbi:MAG: hydroxymethylbilane synthase [Phycisphaerae bacterium]